MKTILLFFLIIPLIGNCQIFKTTGPDLQPQITQYLKTIDSTKIALSKTKDTVTSLKAQVKTLLNQYSTMQQQLKAKSDSILLLKGQVKTANDTIVKYKTLYLSGGIYKTKADSLTKALDQCKNPTQLDSAQLAFYKNIPIDFVSPDNNTIFLTENVTVVPWFNSYTIIWRKNTDGTVTRYTMIYK